MGLLQIVLCQYPHLKNRKDAILKRYNEKILVLSNIKG